MSDIENKEAAEQLLSALGEQLAAAGQRYELVVIGGSGLLALGIVARDFSLPADWLNPGPTDLLDFGLPEGFIGRLERRDYGQALTVYFASRYDQIHFKLYALVDQGPGKHEDDLRALSPTDEEFAAAARWSRLHDPSEGYAQVLGEVLAHMGVKDVDLGS